MPLKLVERDYGIYVYELPAVATAEYQGVGRCIAYAIKLANTGEYMVKRTGDPASESIVPTKIRAIESLLGLFDNRFFVN